MDPFWQEVVKRVFFLLSSFYENTQVPFSICRRKPEKYYKKKRGSCLFHNSSWKHTYKTKAQVNDDVKKVFLFEVRSYRGEKWGGSYGDGDVRQALKWGTSQTSGPLTAIFVIPRSSFRLILQQEALKASIDSGKKSS